MRRVLVMGPPGSGKSTLARQIAKTYGLPVFHLDQAFHQPGWNPVRPEIFQAEVARIAALSEWVIDGNYTETAQPRLQNADTIIYLDVANWRSTLRVLKRTVTSHGQVRPDGPAGCLERFNLEFLRYTWNWNRTKRARALHLVEAFRGRRIILRGVREQQRFLTGDLT